MNCLYAHFDSSLAQGCSVLVSGVEDSADDVPLPEGGHKGAKIPAAEDTAEVVEGWIENIQVMQTGSA